MSDNPSQVLEAIEGFATEIDGDRIVVNRKLTRVSADSAVAKRYPQFFRPVEEGLSYRTEEATAEPGVARDRPVVQSPQPSSDPEPSAPAEPESRESSKQAGKTPPRAAQHKEKSNG